jgi:putative hydrolase of the HAD superfamily
MAGSGVLINSKTAFLKGLPDGDRAARYSSMDGYAGVKVRAVVFDFGGVIAEEGFRAGLHAIAIRFGLDPDTFYQAATEAVYASGYITGTGSEADFWQQLRAGFGITGPDRELRFEVLKRFVPRARMLATVRAIRKRGHITALLSDQSDWLDLLDGRYHFFTEFDYVFNSYHLGKTKRDASLFDDTVRVLNVPAPQVLFIDDNPDHVKRATGRGLQTHLFTSVRGFRAALAKADVLSEQS